ncbi:MAG: hypothetical protein WBD40_06380 [Tepidisphaeraceae bacterium]
MYREPFRTTQRNEATAVLRSMKAFHTAIRSAFRPRDAHERSLAREYQQIATEFAAVLRAPDVRMDVAQLNALQLRSDIIAFQYMLLRGNLSRNAGND